MKNLTWCVLMLLAVPLVTYASPVPPPSWWTGIIGGEENNYAPANLGQLKHIATRAREHLDQALAPRGGAGGAINDAVNFPPVPLIDNYAPINLGQLKNVAKPFYQRLRQMGFDTNRNLKDYGYPSEWSSVFPWLESTPAAENYLPANIGQLKAVFAFEYIPTLISPDAEHRDSDGDGIPDVDEPPGDFDGDGLENWEDTDRDNDGTNDDADFFPDDDRRSENIPVKYYGVIDLSQYNYPDGEPAAATDAKHIAINDEGKVSWVTSEQSPEDGSMSYTITKWSNGALLNRETLQDVSHTTNSEDGQSIQELIHNITNLNGDGTWIGSIIDSNYAQHFSTGQPATGHWQRVRGMPGELAVPPSLLLSFDPPLTDAEDNYPYVDGNGGNKVIVEDVTPAGTPIGYIIYNIRDDGDYRAITRVFRGSPDGPYSHPVALNERWHIRGISSAGDVLLSRSSEVNVDLNGDVDTLWDNSGTVTHLGRVGARSVNAQRQVVGTQTVSGYINGVPTNFNGNDPRGELGFLWENGQLTTFHDLLPEKFKKQLRSAVPFLITNVDPVTNKPKITFSAESWEGQPGQEAWVAHSYTFEWDIEGQPQVDIIMLPRITDAATGQTREINASLVACNKSGVFVGMVERAAAGAGASGQNQSAAAEAPGVIIPLDFKSREKFSEGFDPPMTGDVDHLTGKKDEDDWVPWTSVAKSGTNSVNKRVKVVVPDATMAALLELHVADDSTELITISRTDLTGVETEFDITGKSGDNDIKTATIELRTKPTQPPTVGPQVVRSLKVMVLPPRGPIDVNFYVVRNSKSISDKFLQQPWDPPAVLETASNYVLNAPGVAKPADIIAEIKERMKPCAVDVSSSNAAPDKIVAFDNNPRDYNVNFDEKATLGLQANGFGGKCAILYVPGVKGAEGMFLYGTKLIVLDAGTFIANADSADKKTEDAVGAIGSMKRVAAHEFGHFLTMSTREWNLVPTMRDVGHDKGPFPKGTVGLMRKGELLRSASPGRWTRHEDWKAANDKARDLTQ